MGLKVHCSQYSTNSIDLTEKEVEHLIDILTKRVLNSQFMSMRTRVARAIGQLHRKKMEPLDSIEIVTKEIFVIGDIYEIVGSMRRPLKDDEPIQFKIPKEYRSTW